MITAEKFEASVGCKPENDDLDRCNCVNAGNIFHVQCGWDKGRDMPVFIPGTSKLVELARTVDQFGRRKDSFTYRSSAKK